MVVGVLEDEADLAVDLPWRQLSDIGSIEHDAAFGRLQQPVDDFEKRRFPRAVGAEEAHKVPALHVEPDIVHSGRAIRVDKRIYGDAESG